MRICAVGLTTAGTSAAAGVGASLMTIEEWALENLSWTSAGLTAVAEELLASMQCCSPGSLSTSQKGPGRMELLVRLQACLCFLRMVTGRLASTIELLAEPCGLLESTQRQP